MQPVWPAACVTIGDAKIHYYRSGGAKPPLVLAHGFTDDGLCWLRLARVLEKDYDLIMYDAWGHGLSDGPAGPDVPWRDSADDLAGLIGALGLVKPAAMGHSMGAATVALAASRYPDLLRCAVLEDPPYHTPRSVPEFDNTTNPWKQQVESFQKMTVAEVMAAGRAQNPRWAEIEFEPWARSKQTFNLAMFSARKMQAPRWQDVVSQIHVPVLLIHGDTTLGGLVSPEIAKEFAAVVPQTTVEHIAGAGHNVRREQFDQFVEALSWLRVNGGSQ